MNFERFEKIKKPLKAYYAKDSHPVSDEDFDGIYDAFDKMKMRDPVFNKEEARNLVKLALFCDFDNYKKQPNHVQRVMTDIENKLL